MKIRIPEWPTTIDSPTGPILVRPYQLVIHVRLLTESGSSPTFPAVVDTGHSHNFSISEQQLHDWAKVSLKATRIIRVNGRPVPVAKADLEIGGIRLALPEGIAVFTSDHPGVTRLPLIGLRALVRNGLRLNIDGRRLRASISRSWRLWS